MMKWLILAMLLAVAFAQPPPDFMKHKKEKPKKPPPPELKPKLGKDGKPKLPPLGDRPPKMRRDPDFADIPKAAKTKESREEKLQHHENMHGWWCKDGDRMHTKLCMQYYKIAPPPDAAKGEKMALPVDEIEEMHDAFCQLEDHMGTPGCRRWNSRPPKGEL